jgi:hypothetical protein
MKKQIDLEQVKPLGKEWIKENMHRVYIDNPEKYMGLIVGYYGTGNVSGAMLNGESISNTKAKGILAQIGKVFYDVNKGEFSYDRMTNAVYGNQIVAGLNELFV